MDYSRSISLSLIGVCLLIGTRGADGQYLIHWDQVQETRAGPDTKGAPVVYIPANETAVRLVWGKILVDIPVSAGNEASGETTPIADTSKPKVEQTKESPKQGKQQSNDNKESDQKKDSSKRRRNSHRLYTVKSAADNNLVPDGRVDSGIPTESGDIVIELIGLLNDSNSDLVLFCSEHSWLSLMIRLPSLHHPDFDGASLLEGVDDDGSQNASPIVYVGIGVGLLVAILMIVGISVQHHRRKKQRTEDAKVILRKPLPQVRAPSVDGKKQPPVRLLEVLRIGRQQQRALELEQEVAAAKRLGKSRSQSRTNIHSADEPNDSGSGWNFLSVSHIHLKVQNWLASPRGSKVKLKIDRTVPDNKSDMFNSPTKEIVAAWQNATSSVADGVLDTEPHEPEPECTSPATRDHSFSPVVVRLKHQSDFEASLQEESSTDPVAANALVEDGSRSPSRQVSVQKESPDHRSKGRGFFVQGGHANSALRRPSATEPLGGSVRWPTVAAEYKSPPPADYEDSIASPSAMLSPTPPVDDGFAVARARLDFEPASYDETALALTKGDLIHIVHRHPNGLWEGVVIKSDGTNGEVGYFPFTMVDVLDDAEYPEHIIALKQRVKEEDESLTYLKANLDFSESGRPSPITLSGNGRWPFTASARANPLLDDPEPTELPRKLSRRTITMP